MTAAMTTDTPTTQIRSVQKKYGTKAMAIAIFLALGLILIGHKDMGNGLVLGTFFSIVNFVLMGQGLQARICRSRGKAFARSLSSILLRYAVMAVPLIAAIKYQQFNLPATILGLFMIQVLILSEQFWTRVGWGKHSQLKEG